MLYFGRGSENLSSQDLKEGLFSALEKLGKKHKVLAVPPDITRFYSRAGELSSKNLLLFFCQLFHTD
jgi:hypothetical protein